MPLQPNEVASRIALASMMVGLCEGLAYARKVGVQPQSALDAMEAAATLASREASHMLEGDYEPGLTVARLIQEMSGALDTAEEINVEVPGLELARMLYQEVAEMGSADSGMQALFTLWDDEEDGDGEPGELVQLRRL